MPTTDKPTCHLRMLHERRKCRLCNSRFQIRTRQLVWNDPDISKSLNEAAISKTTKKRAIIPDI